MSHSLPACICIFNRVGRVWTVWMLMCSCGDQVLAVDYRWLAGFWISFLWYPLNAFTPFEVMSVLKYLSPFMFNHGCLRSRILSFFFTPPFIFYFFIFFSEGGDESITNSQHPSKSGKKSGKKSRIITEHDLLKHGAGLLLCRRRVIRARRRRRRGLKSWMTGRILTELARPPCHWIWSTDCVCFAAVMSFTVCAVMCQELIRMLDELANCSQCIFPQSHGSSDLDSFSLYFTSLCGPVLLPGCMWGISHCWNWLW